MPRAIISLVLTLQHRRPAAHGLAGRSHAAKHVMLLIYLLVAGARSRCCCLALRPPRRDVRVRRRLRPRARRRVPDHPADGGGAVRHRACSAGVMGIVLTADGVAEATAPMLVGYLRDRHRQLQHRLHRCWWRSRWSAPPPSRCFHARAAARERRRASLMKITDAKVIVCSPGRNFVTLKIVTEDGVYGLGDATLNGRELAVASYLTRSRAAAAHRPRRAPHRGHLAVPLQRRVLAARSGDDDARSRAVDTALWDILGQDAEHAGLSAARRRVARRR